MRIRCLTSLAPLLLLAKLSFAADCGTTSTASCTLGEHPFFDVQAFGDMVVDRFSLSFPGYAVALIDARGNLVARVSRGNATQANDPEGAQRFRTIDTKSRLASVSKIITVATALLLIEERAEAGVAISPETPIRDVAPDFIVANLASRYRFVTLADLMRHTAGFPKDYSGQQLWEIAAGQPQSTGSSLPPVGDRNYSNVGIDFLGFLLPFIADPDLYAIEDTLSSPLSGCSIDCIEETLQGIAYGRYVTLARELILEPAGIEADCRYQTFIGQPDIVVARAYTNALARTGLFVDYPNRACPSGGWIMTAVEMARLGYALGRDHFRLMSPESYSLMETVEVPSDDRYALGWNPPAGSLPNNAPLYNRVWTHGGLLNWSTGGISGTYSARLIRLPNGMSAAALVNSPHPTNSCTSCFLRDQLIAAYEAGVAGEAAKTTAVTTSALFP